MRPPTVGATLVSVDEDSIRGVPGVVYVDNGSNYSSKEFAIICTRLGIVLIHTPVRAGAAKGNGADDDTAAIQAAPRALAWMASRT